MNILPDHRDNGQCEGKRQWKAMWFERELQEPQSRLFTSPFSRLHFNSPLVSLRGGRPNEELKDAKSRIRTLEPWVSPKWSSFSFGWGFFYAASGVRSIYCCWIVYGVVIESLVAWRSSHIDRKKIGNWFPLLSISCCFSVFARYLFRRRFCESLWIKKIV